MLRNLRRGIVNYSGFRRSIYLQADVACSAKRNHTVEIGLRKHETIQTRRLLSLPDSGDIRHGDWCRRGISSVSYSHRTNDTSKSRSGQLPWTSTECHGGRLCVGLVRSSTIFAQCVPSRILQQRLGLGPVDGPNDLRHVLRLGPFRSIVAVVVFDSRRHGRPLC